MPATEEWNPGSFTKNFSWGTPSEGLKRLYDSIRVGFDNRVEDARRTDFRKRVTARGWIDFIPVNFFLFNKTIANVDYLLADELVYQAINFPHSDRFDKLALVAFNLSYAGRWKGAHSYQERPALWAHHYIVDRVANQLNWDTSKITADDIQSFVRSDNRYHAKTSRKLATNLNYLYDIGRLKELDTPKVQRWWVDSLFLAMDRLIEDRLIHDQPTESSRWAAFLDRSNFHFVSGRRSVEKDLATKHLLKLYEACGARIRFSEEEVRERQSLLLPHLSWFANQNDPIAALHPSNPRIAKTIPRACAMLARHVGFIDLDLDQLENLDVEQFIKDQTRKALQELQREGIKPTMSAEELMKLTREK